MRAVVTRYAGVGAAVQRLRVRPSQHSGAVGLPLALIYRTENLFSQSALRMLKSQDPVIHFPERPPNPGKIFDAEDTARHAVSALKCVLLLIRVLCLLRSLCCICV